jgi:hypothetical protein
MRVRASTVRMRWEADRIVTMTGLCVCGWQILYAGEDCSHSATVDMGRKPRCSQVAVTLGSQEIYGDRFRV